MKVTLQPEIRAQHSYKGVVTVLEGGELAKLTEMFFSYMNAPTKDFPEDYEERIDD